MNTHLAVNLGITGLVWLTILIIVWVYLASGIIIKAILSTIGLIGSAYAGHNIIPRITGPIIEKRYKHKGPNKGVQAIGDKSPQPDP